MFSLGFEEDYCLQIADRADPTDQKKVEPTAEERKRGITSVGLGYRVHMQCHERFSFPRLSKIIYSDFFKLNLKF